jgi:hypothetical protein
LIRVVPDYQGSWQGTTLTTGCTAILDYERGGLCSAFVGRAQTGVFLSQSRDTVSGQLFIGTFPLTVSGTIGQPGGLTLTGAGSTNGFDILLVNWATFAQGSVMTGTFTFRVSGGGVSGNVTVSTTIDRHNDELPGPQHEGSGWPPQLRGLVPFDVHDRSQTNAETCRSVGTGLSRTSKATWAGAET